MHALKLYGPRTGRQNSYGAARSPWTAREQPARGPGLYVTGALDNGLLPARSLAITWSYAGELLGRKDKLQGKKNQLQNASFETMPLKMSQF